jgi:hypothetical protein
VSERVTFRQAMRGLCSAIKDRIKVEIEYRRALRELHAVARRRVAASKADTAPRGGV